MKKIDKLTEEQILSLTNEDMAIMVKLEKAERGIKILTPPEKPNYHIIPDKNCEVYYCGVFGDIAFTDVNELQGLLDYVRKSKTAGQKKYSSQGYSFTNEIKPSYSSDEWDKISTERVYSKDVFDEVKEKIKENEVLKKQYEEQLKDYQKYKDEHNEIESNIYGVFNEVYTKFEKLKRYVRLMRNEYMPLAENKEKIALGFLTKAYLLNEEEKQYVIDNYKEKE